MLFENLLTSINKLVWKENLKCLINLRNDYHTFWRHMSASLEKPRNTVVAKVPVK